MIVSMSNRYFKIVRLFSREFWYGYGILKQHPPRANIGEVVGDLGPVSSVQPLFWTKTFVSCLSQNIMASSIYKRSCLTENCYPVKMIPISLFEPTLKTSRVSDFSSEKDLKILPRPSLILCQHKVKWVPYQSRNPVCVYFGSILFEIS